jgi:hypothetical protein
MVLFKPVLKHANHRFHGYGDSLYSIQLDFDHHFGRFINQSLKIDKKKDFMIPYYLLSEPAPPCATSVGKVMTVGNLATP